jgi:hypothetical protein
VGEPGVVVANTDPTKLAAVATVAAKTVLIKSIVGRYIYALP